MSFVHLHPHSEYSLLDGANRIPELVKYVQGLGMDSLAVTDHGNLHCAWSFYEEATARGLRPILGFEAYLAFGPRTSMQKPQGAPAQYSHLVLLASLRETAVEDALHQPIANLDDALRVASVRHSLEQRRDALRRLAGSGALFLDALPADLPVALVNRYLDVKAAGVL